MLEFMHNTRIVKVISGGQTGADQGGLEAAYQLGIPTGGEAPAGYRTQDGNNPELLRDRYELTENSSRNYPPRTRVNVKSSDITIILGNHQSPGCRLTIQYCVGHKRPYTIVNDFSDSELQSVVNDIKSTGGDIVLNVAGNRERSMPGLFNKSVHFIRNVIQQINE